MTRRPGTRVRIGNAEGVREVAPRDAARDNGLLGLLPGDILARILPHLEPVRLEKRDVLFRAHEPLTAVYFPTTAVVSFVARLESGETLVVGTVGRDGVAGTAISPWASTMPCDGIVQIQGLALRIAADALKRESLAHEPLYSLIGRYGQVVLARSMQLSVCNTFHSVEQRCIRWLLRVDDLITHDYIPVTHEAVAAAIGVHRPTVTLVLRALQREGLLEEERGRIALRDRTRLEAACCECYRSMVAEQRRLLGP